jgi:hypothetical protein
MIPSPTNFPSTPLQSNLTIISWSTMSFNLLVGFQVTLAVVMNSYIFLYITPCSPLKTQKTFRKNLSPRSSGLKSIPRNKLRWNRRKEKPFDYCLAYTSALKIEATYSFITLNDNCCENLKSYRLAYFENKKIHFEDWFSHDFIIILALMARCKIKCHRFYPDIRL